MIWVAIGCHAARSNFSRTGLGGRSWLHGTGHNRLYSSSRTSYSASERSSIQIVHSRLELDRGCEYPKTTSGLKENRLRLATLLPLGDYLRLLDRGSTHFSYSPLGSFAPGSAHVSVTSGCKVLYLGCTALSLPVPHFISLMPCAPIDTRVAIIKWIRMTR